MKPYSMVIVPAWASRAPSLSLRSNVFFTSVRLLMVRIFPRLISSAGPLPQNGQYTVSPW